MKKLIISVFFMSTLLLSEKAQSNEQINGLLKQAFQVIWQEAMIAKHQAADVLPNIREELLENLCSSAPAVYFTTHADLSDSLTQAENTSASVFVSTDNQSSWSENSDVMPLNQEGYETTWGATTITSGGKVIKPNYEDVNINMGMQRGERKGNLIIRFVVAFPTTLNAEQKALIEKVL